MRIAYLSYERELDLEKDHQIYYTDIQDLEKRGYNRVINDIVKFNPDYVIEREFNEQKALYMTLLYQLKIKLPQVIRAKWFIDTHEIEQLHQSYTDFVDVGFFAIQRCIKVFGKLLGENNAFWLPLCYPHKKETISLNYQPTKYPVSFVGNWNNWSYPERTNYIERLKDYYGKNFYAITDFNNMLGILKQSKVSFNNSIRDDLNFRVFEVLGMGAELVTNSVPDLHKIKGLKDKSNIYSDFRELVTIIDKLLSNDPTVAHNTLETQEWIKNNHTLYNRQLEMLYMLKERRQYAY